MVAAAVTSKCDALDGLADGIIGNVKACKAAFSLSRDVPLCTGTRDGSCLTYSQKTVLGNIFAGARNSAGDDLYASLPFDAGIGGSNWRAWKFVNSTGLARDPGAVAFIFSTPPLTNTTTFVGLPFALSFDVDVDAPKIFATSALYTESPMSFMTPPGTTLSTLKNRGAKLMIYHGVGDPVFSFNDTVNWYENIAAANSGDATQFARLFPVPGMNHCSGGPSTDRFDMLTPLVNWVEQGIAPASVEASARSSNAERPVAWSATRTRPLCAWPKVATYKGSGDIEAAASFSCQ